MHPSDEQRNGTYYLAAGRARLPNMGEKHIRIQTGKGKQCRVRMQVTNVRKPLLSVARMCDENNRVVVERTGGYPGSGCTSRGRATPKAWRSRPFRSRVLPGRGGSRPCETTSDPRKPD